MSRLAQLPNPADHYVIRIARKAVARILGFRNKKAHPLYEFHIKQLYERFAASEQANKEDITFMFLVALAYNACL